MEGVGNNKGKESHEPQMVQEDTNFKKQVSVAVNNAIGINTTLQTPETKVNARVELSIKLDLVYGPTGVWNVARAQVLQDTSKPPVKEKAGQPDFKKIVYPLGPVNKQPTRVWQPISKPSNTKTFQPVHGSSSTIPRTATLKASLVGHHNELSGDKKSGDSLVGHQPGASHDSSDPLSNQSEADLAFGLDPESALVPISPNPKPRLEIRALFREAMAAVCVNRTWGSSSD